MNKIKIPNSKATYPLNLEVNGHQFSKIDISHHYLEKHPDITDELILELLKLFVNKKNLSAWQTNHWLLRVRKNTPPWQKL